MPASTLTQQSGALQARHRLPSGNDKKPMQDLRRFLARKPSSYLFLRTFLSPKREGLANLQFKLLSVGSQGDPNMMIYTNSRSKR